MYIAFVETVKFLTYPVSYALATYQTETTTLILIIDQVNEDVKILEFSNDIVLGAEYCTYSLTGISSTLFNIKPEGVHPTLDLSTLLFTPLLWYREFDLTEYIVRPQFLLGLAFTSYSELDNKFNILHTFPIPQVRSLLEDFNKFTDIYTPSTTFTGISTSLSHLAKDIHDNYIRQYDPV